MRQFHRLLESILYHYHYTAWCVQSLNIFIEYKLSYQQQLLNEEGMDRLGR